MPRPSREPSHADQAAAILDEVTSSGPLDKIDHLLAQAQVHALLAVAKELDRVRDQIGGVEMALRGPDEHGAGTSLHYISDWLEKISRK
ncbi:hypothetical protein [Actinoplanes sp. NPDC026670]|uniref:hypothetical protein n=1 Tax=Actinoplanes sp. NPDC026670 TaxID=3154700 RepID=UPI0033C4588A